MCKKYLNRLNILKSLIKSYGLKKEEIDALIFSNSNWLYLPEELYLFCEHIGYTEDLSLEVFYNLGEAVEVRSEYIDLFDFKNWIPLCVSDGFIYFATLNKIIKRSCEIYYADIGSGDSNIYLYSTDFFGLVELEIERISVLKRTGKELCYRDLYLKYIPDAYPYYEKKEQKGVFSPNGVRNIYDMLDIEALPKEWF